METYWDQIIDFVMAVFGIPQVDLVILQNQEEDIKEDSFIINLYFID